MLSRYSTPAYGDGYVYPSLSITLAMFAALLPVLVMVGVGIKEFIYTKGELKEVSEYALSWTYICKYMYSIKQVRIEILPN